MRSLVAVGLLCVPTLLAAQTPTPSAPAAPADAAPPPLVLDARPITLEEALRLARQNNPQAIQARGQVRNAAATVRRSYAAFLPSLNFSASTGYTTGVTYFQGELVPTRGDPWSYRNGLNANLTLFDGGARFRELSASRANERAAEANETLQDFNVALSVKQQYYNVLAAREAEAAARTQLEQARQNFRVANARVQAGAATKSDSLRSAIEVRNAEIAILQAQQAVLNASASLTRLTGQQQLVTAVPGDTLEPIRIAVDSVQLVELARQAPSVRQARAALAAANASVKAANAPYWPTISVSGSYGVNQSAPRFQGGNLWLMGEGGNPNSKSVSFQLSYPIFNQLQRETQIVQARVAEDNAEAAVRDAELAVQQQLVQAYGQYELALARIELQQASVEAAEEDLRVQRQRYELGASTLLDVLTSQSTLNQARVSLIQARLDARVAKAQLEAIVGREL